MSATEALAIIAAVWLGIGVLLAFVLGQRGYDAWFWFVVGAVLGPLSVPFVVARVRPQEISGGDDAETDASLDDKTDVVVGIDGSPEAVSAARGVQALLGSRLGRVMLATVIPFDASPSARRDADETLQRAEAAFPTGRAQHIVLRGFPAHILHEYAKTAAFDAIAVGTTGRGLARTLLGSVATELAHRTKVPVMLFGSDR